MRLGHGVQRTAILKPLNLSFVECVCQLCLPWLAVLGMNSQGHGLADREFRAHHIQSVIGLNLVVVGGVDESKGQHALFLEIGLVLGKISA